MVTGQPATDKELASITSIVDAYGQLLKFVADQRELIVEERFRTLLSQTVGSFSDRVAEVHKALNASGPELALVKESLGKEGLSGDELALKVEIVRAAFERSISGEGLTARSGGHYAAISFDEHRQEFVIGNTKAAGKELRDAGSRDRNVLVRFVGWIRGAFSSGAPVIKSIVKAVPVVGGALEEAVDLIEEVVGVPPETAKDKIDALLRRRGS